MAMNANLRPLTVGEVLDRSFQVLRRHVGPLFVTAVIGVAPMFLIYLTTGVPYGATVSVEQAAAAALMMMVLAVALMVTTGVTWGALTHQVGRAAEGEPVGLADGLKQGFRRFFPVVGLWIVLGFAAFVLMIPFVLAAGVVGGVVAVIAGEGLVSTLVMFIAITAAMVGVGLLWTPLMFLGLPAVVLEGKGPIEAVKRAHGLGKGARRRLLVTALVAWILMLLPTFGLPFLLGIGTKLWSSATAGTVSTTVFYVYQAAAFLLAGFTTPFMVAVMVFSYYDRRVRREGLDVELASASNPEPV